MSNLYRDIAWKIINLRQSQRLTQTALGKKTNLSRYQILRIESGLGDTTLENLTKIANYFEIELKDLFTSEEMATLRMKNRPSSIDTSESKITSKTYAKVFHENAKVKTITISSKSIRKIKIEPNQTTDIYILEGSVSLQSSYDIINASKHDLITIKGFGFVRIVNVTNTPAALLRISY